MKRLSIFLIFLIIAISGCIGDGGTSFVSTKDGVVITETSFEQSPVYAGDYVGLRLEIQNVGDSKAELKRIQVYGVDFNDAGPGSRARKWGRRNSDTDLVGNEIGKTELYQPDPNIDLEGQKYYREWRLQAPTGVSSETDYDFRVRIKYDYSTNYTGVMRVIDDTYLQSLDEEKRQELFSSGGIASSVLTNGPISVTPYSSRHFIVSPGDPAQNRPIKFKIENVGKGYPYVEDPPGTIRNYYIKVMETGGIANCEKDPVYGEIKLSSGESINMNCEFTTPITSDFTNKIDKPFQIMFKYSYYIDGSASITVNPAY